MFKIWKVERICMYKKKLAIQAYHLSRLRCVLIIIALSLFLLILLIEHVFLFLARNDRVRYNRTTDKTPAVQRHFARRSQAVLSTAVCTRLNCDVKIPWSRCPYSSSWCHKKKDRLCCRISPHFKYLDVFKRHQELVLPRKQTREYFNKL